MKIVLGICLIFHALVAIESLKILSVFSFCAHSHYTLGYRISKELADRGHEVTMINCFPQKKPVKNLKEISVGEVLKYIIEWNKQLTDFGKLSYVGQLEWVMELGLFYTEKVLETKSVQDLMNSNEQFDLVITEHFVNDAMAIFHHRFKCPQIFLAPGPTTILNNHLLGNPAPTSYVANLLSDYDSRMTFWQRLQNTYLHVIGELFVHFRLIPEQNKLLKAAFPDAPELSSILYNASLLLLTSHFSLSEPVPLQQNIKPIGGFHVSPPKPLPANIQKFLDEAKDGVVLFSMGSNLKSADLQPETKKGILNAFSKIKQKVLWKFEIDLPEKPDNVMIMEWLPQQDIMAHPNVVAFISHGGLLGTIEAVYHGVPILGLPVFWDQTKNMEDAARRGFAIKLDLKNVNEERFTEALKEILNDPSYRNNAKKRSAIMHDQPMKQIDEAVFWIEYVAKHNGAPHLKSIAVNLPWYQIYLLDIIVFNVTLLIILVIFIKCIIKYLMPSNKNLNKLKKN